MASKTGSRRVRLKPHHDTPLEYWRAALTSPETRRLAVFWQVNALEPVIRDNGLIYIDALKSTTDLGQRMKFIAELDEPQLKRVVDALITGHETSDWDDFANLDIVTEIPIRENLDIPEEKEQLIGVSASWSAPCQGNSDKLLDSHIHHFYQKKVGSQIYENMCAIVQSSGTGKSRLVDEYAKSRLVIPINLREAETGYPPPDCKVREYLAERLNTKTEIRGRCIGFLIRLFECTLKYLREETERHPAITKTDLIGWFHSRMSPASGVRFRDSFFGDVLKRATQKQRETTMTNTSHMSFRHQQATENAEESSGMRSSKQDKDDSTEAADTSLPESHNTATETEIAPVSRLHRAASQLIEFLHSLKKNGAEDLKSPRIEVVLAFDEAHTLCQNICHRGNTEPWSNFTALRDALNSIHSLAVWTLFLSTSTKVSQLNPHRGIDPLAQSRTGRYAAVPPFTTLRYDAFAPNILIDKEGRMMKQGPTLPSIVSTGRSDTVRSDLTLEDVTRMKFMVRFGRPLFATLWEYSGALSRDTIVRFAVNKLICTTYHAEMDDETKMNIAFACLSQRLCLEFDSSSHNFDEERHIEAHMRLGLKIGADNKFTISSSGSEPLLAEAASTLMLQESFKPAEWLKSILSGFSVNKGDRGELVAMLAVTVARDMAVEERSDNFGIANSVLLGQITARDDNNLFRAVTVCEFLGKLFKLDDPIMKALEADFRNAYVYFNHFIKPYTQDTCTLHFLLQYMTRGAAVLCANCMPGITFLLAALFRSKGGLKLRVDRLTGIYNQVKNVVGLTFERDAEDIFDDMLKGIAKSTGPGGCKLPIIRVIFSLLSEDGLKYRSRTIKLPNGTSVKTHDFWCGGFGPHFLYGDQGKETQDTWRALADASVKMKQLFNDKEEARGIGEERKFSTPGGSSGDAFWGWISESESSCQDTTDDELATGYVKNDWDDDDVEMEDAGP